VKHLPCDIPNQAGFRLRLWLKDGRTIDTTVDREPTTGCHFLVGVNIQDVGCWEAL